MRRCRRTMREQGYDIGRLGYNWFWGPAGMPPAVVDVVYQHLNKAINDPEIRKLFATFRAEASGIPPAEMASEVRKYHDYWAPVIRDLGVALD